MKVCYNGIILRNAYTEEWNEECVYDPSGVNLLGNKITFTFIGNVFYPTNVAGGLFTDQSLAAAQIETQGTAGYINSTNISRPVAFILRALQMPRKALELYYDGSVSSFFTAYPQHIPASGETPPSAEEKANYDVNNGPKPLSVSVSMVSSKHVTVRFRIEVTKVRCFGGDTGYIPAGGQNPQSPDNVQVLSNRCWTEETMDGNFFTTRTFSGTLRLSSPNISAHNFRNLLYPELERGFKRESMIFAESEDGMSLNYRIVDKQVYNAAPWPATSMSGEVRVEGRNICEYFLTVNVSLIGNPGADKRDLISRLIQIYATQVNKYTHYNDQSGGISTLGSVPKYFTLVDHIGETPEVSLQAQAQIFPSSTNSDNPSGGMVTLPSLPTMGDEFTLSKDDIIGSFLLEPDPDNENGVIEYDRRDSHKPNVFGYNIFGLSTDTTEGDNKNQAYCSFIKCLATSPCEKSNPVSSVWQSVSSDAPPETIAVSVAKKGTMDARNTPRTQTASQESQVYPITYYTSYITASTSYNRVLLPVFKTGTTITSDSVTNVVAELAEPTMTIDVVIEAERMGQYPTFPDPEKTYYICKDGNEEETNKLTCLSYTVDMMEPNRDQTGNRQAYRANAHYKYAADRHFINTDNVKLTYNAEINNVANNATPGHESGLSTVSAEHLFSGNQLEPDTTPETGTGE